MFSIVWSDTTSGAMPLIAKCRSRNSIQLIQHEISRISCSTGELRTDSHAWEQRQLGEVAEKTGSGGTPTSSNPRYYGGSIPFLGIGDINGRYVDTTQKTLTEEGVANSAAWIVPEGAISLAMYASYGKSAILARPMATSQAFFNIVFRSNVTRDFVYSRLQCAESRHEWDVLVSTGTQPNLSGSKLKKWTIGYPSLPEQRRIGEFFSTLDNLIAAAERQETLLRQKKQAYLQLMFPQEGETEPHLRFQEFSDSWERHQLGEVIRPIKVIPVSRYSRHGRFPVIQQGDHPIAGYSSDEPYFQYSVVVLFGDHTLSLYRPESPFLLASDGLKVLSCDFPGNDFLYAMLERYKPSNEGYKRHFSILKKQHCSFPSLPEQRRIGGFFSTLDNLIAAAEQRAESLHALKSAYLQRMFV